MAVFPAAVLWVLLRLLLTGQDRAGQDETKTDALC